MQNYVSPPSKKLTTRFWNFARTLISLSAHGSSFVTLVVTISMIFLTVNRFHTHQNCRGVIERCITHYSRPRTESWVIIVPEDTSRASRVWPPSRFGVRQKLARYYYAWIIKRFAPTSKLSSPLLYILQDFSPIPKLNFLDKKTQKFSNNHNHYNK